MKILVCIKEVPDMNTVKFDPLKGTLIRNGIDSIINPSDLIALENALSIKDKLPNTTITVLSMGIPTVKDALQECLARGADEAFLLTDKSLSGSDAWATSYALSSCIKAIGNYDLILMGDRSLDGDTGQVPGHTSEALGLPQATHVKEIMHIDGQEILVKKQVHSGEQIVKLILPCLLSINHLGLKARYMSVKGIFKSVQMPIQVLDVDTLGIDRSQIGIDGSPTKVFHHFTYMEKKDCKMIHGDSSEHIASNLLKLLPH